MVLIVNKVVEEIEMSELEVYYRGGGCSPYYPKMMIKLWIYGYCERVYTSRRLSKMTRENIYYMWLPGGHQPCFKTLSDFRSGKLQKMVDTVFRQVLEMLIELGYVDLDELYVDGTKLEANANRHKWYNIAPKEKPIKNKPKPYWIPQRAKRCDKNGQ